MAVPRTKSAPRPTRRAKRLGVSIARRRRRKEAEAAKSVHPTTKRVSPRPLTPALSPSEGESEKRRQSVSESKRFEMLGGRTSLLPLPFGRGEGRGEGSGGDSRSLQSPRRASQGTARPPLRPGRSQRAPLQFRWAETISKPGWTVYRRAIQAIREARLPFLLGGGFALAAFTGRWRDTKDIDFYIHPRDRATAISALKRAGFKDYYSRLPYDRKWIYRSVRRDVIVDVIWSMANQRAQVDDLWFQRAEPLRIRGEDLLVIPLEELAWCKLYILQRDHCDWTDLFNLTFAVGPQVDWDYLLWRLDEDAPLLGALLTVYGWLCPHHARQLPRKLWSRLRVPLPPLPRRRPPRARIRLLDSRRWFAAFQPAGRKLEV